MLEVLNYLIDNFLWFIDVFLHLDLHLATWSAALGPWVYALLFAIIFCETGLVIAPFLPGDSLLFAVGALTTLEGSQVTLANSIALLIVAAVLGDYLNYSVGKYFGTKLLASRRFRFINPNHIAKTNEFYAKHGGKTIVLARFLPIIRTFAPFVAGMAEMSYFHFAIYNVLGAIAWVLSFLLLGYFFGNLPGVKSQFHWVVVGIVLISFLPVGIEIVSHYYRKYRQTRR